MAAINEPVNVELRIEWEGDAPGVANHRLSLAAFADALQKLLAAARRTASNILTEAIDETERGARGGRLAAIAETFDVEIASVSNRHLNVTACITTKRIQPELIDGIEERVVLRLVDDLESESSGRPSSASVRKFLRALPAGLRRQRYIAFVDGVEKKAIEFGEVSAATIQPPIAGIELIVGRVIAIGFEPGEPFVQIQRAPRLSATTRQVEHALALHADEVQALVLLQPAPRLLWIRPASKPFEPESPGVRAAAIHSRWGDVLRKLAT